MEGEVKLYRVIRAGSRLQMVLNCTGTGNIRMQKGTFGCQYKSITWNSG